MGFMDKAKKLAEQAQTKLDEVQKQFNEGQSSGSGSPGPAVEYDHHGRPMRTEPAAEPAPPPAEAATPPHGDPLAEAPEPPAPPSPPAPAAEEGDRNEESYAPPKLTGGDPLR